MYLVLSALVIVLSIIIVCLVVGVPPYLHTVFKTVELESAIGSKHTSARNSAHADKNANKHNHTQTHTSTHKTEKFSGDVSGWGVGDGTSEHERVDIFQPQSSLGPAFDLDPEFVSSREKMGACGQLSSSRKTNLPLYTHDVTLLGTKNDDLFDGERSTGQVRGANASSGCPRGQSSLRLLYTHMAGPHPIYTGSKEFIGSQGYLYKQ